MGRINISIDGEKYELIKQFHNNKDELIETNDYLYGFWDGVEVFMSAIEGREAELMPLSIDSDIH